MPPGIVGSESVVRCLRRTVEFCHGVPVASISSYTRKLEVGQAKALKVRLQEKGYRFREVPYAQYAAEGGSVNVVMYQSGKLVVQGKETEDFVKFLLEPEILGKAELGYEKLLNPELTAPRLGVDESGKGDLFGPLCVAGVYVNEAVLTAWEGAGVRDSKLISGDRRIGEVADRIRNTPGCIFTVVPIGNPAYNRLHLKLGSVNKILAWGHARVIENLLGQRHRMSPPPVRAVIDQFAASQATVRNALMADGRGLELVQRHKAESDLAVAAASILARDEFVQRLKRLSEVVGVNLPKGAGGAADSALVEVRAKLGDGRLGEVTKLHFRNVTGARS